ncbi:hypothetical protein [Rhodoferax sp. GW822-FHT02A01]|uniref:hypothetical protein n=1 Tax=Rhodoferax sp. GW822-FHT02A01 TaxID=3141537 RepID=UPI00315CCEFA
MEESKKIIFDNIWAGLLQKGESENPHEDPLQDTDVQSMFSKEELRNAASLIRTLRRGAAYEELLGGLRLAAADLEKVQEAHSNPLVSLSVIRALLHKHG